MGEVNISNNTYKVSIITASNELIDISQLVTACSWSDPAEEVAARASFTFANLKTEKGYVSDLLKLCTVIYISANGNERFRGVVWEWEYEYGAGTKEVTVTAYDWMIYAKQSKDNSYYSAGQSTQSIIEDICDRWGISLNYDWLSHTHAKITYKSNSIADQILDTLEEAARKTEYKFAAYMDKGTLYVKYRGQNPTTYMFDGSNSTSVQDKLSLSSLVTKVIIIGKDDEDGRAPIEDTIDGKTEYGILQEIVTRDGDSSLDDARTEANELLREKGKPEETINLEAPDIPEMRKGDKVKIVLGNLSDYFYVKGITHNMVKKTMKVECER